MTRNYYVTATVTVTATGEQVEERSFIDCANVGYWLDECFFNDSEYTVILTFAND